MNKSGKNSKKKSYVCIVFCVGIFLFLPFYLTGCSKKKSSQNYTARVLVLDDCNFENNSQVTQGGDKVLMLDSNGELVKTIDNLKLKTRFDENKAISVSEDGRFFAVCENAINKLTVFETATGREYWSTTWPNQAVSQAIFFNDTLYVSNRTSIQAIDINKKSIRKIRDLWEGGWLDFVFDKKNNCIWAGGMNIGKYNMDFEPVLQLDSVFDSRIAGAFSLDITSDGSVWAAIREAVEKNGLEDKLVKISPEGNVIETIKLDIHPYCICVDSSDDSVWVTGMTSRKDYAKIGDEWPETLTELYETIETDVKTYTYKYSSQGERIVELDKGGYSIDIDPSDRSVWIAAHDSIVHSSGKGDIIKEYNNVSKQHKWIAVVK